MSRSYRHTSKRHYCGGGSGEKPYRIIRHQMMRAAIRQCLHHAHPDEILLPHEQEIYNDWDAGKSGRVWFNEREHPEWMRK